MKILITGGNSDIGHALILRLMSKHEVISTASTQESKKALKKIGLKDVSLCDFENFDPIENPILKTLDQGVDAIILNAWVPLRDYSQFHEQETQNVANYIQSHITTTIALLQRALPAMLRNSFGRIILISSVATEVGLSNHAPYIIAKSALEGLMRNLAVDYGAKGITANTIRPGIIPTKHNKFLLQNTKVADSLARSIPSQTLGHPDQIAEVVETLLSRQSYLNGQAINAAGGLPLNTPLL
jgi:3-oxoacyl-[acyl-carrier protein] reductase